MKKDVILGKIGAVYGIKGWLKIHSFADTPEAIFGYSPWVLNLNGKKTNSNSK
jgi:16S rRNA processing protein RimM